MHIGARLASSADPDEVLISEQAAEQAGRAGIAVVDRGARSLKGRTGALRVLAVEAAPHEAASPASSLTHGRRRDHGAIVKAVKTSEPGRAAYW